MKAPYDGRFKILAHYCPAIVFELVCNCRLVNRMDSVPNFFDMNLR